jgi:hypothetical protein
MASFRHIVFFAAAVLLFSLPAFSAEDPINVEVVINIVGDSNSANVEKALKKANDILGQAGIKLVPVKVNDPFKVGNNDNKLTDAEGYDAVDKGEEELNSTCGSGNGMKVTIANDVWTEKPSTSGWSIHRKPVVFAEPNNDPNKMGRTIAHEICHSLTLNYDLYDPNYATDIMYGYTGGGTMMTPEQIAEIRKGAKRRIPGWLGRTARRAWTWIKKTGKGLLDGLNDLYVNGLPVDISSQPMLQFLDIRTVSALCENPDQPGAALVIEIGPQGEYPPPESFFDVFYHIQFDTNHDTLMDGQLTIRIAREPGMPGPLRSEATYFNMVTGLMMPVPLMVHTNERHYSPIEEGTSYVPMIANNSLEVILPLAMMEIDGRAFLDGVVMTVHQNAMIHSPIGFLNPGDNVMEEIEPMVIRTESPCQCRQVTMITAGRAGNDPQWPEKPQTVEFIGCDFAGDVGLYINDELKAVAVADPDGQVSVRLDVSSFEQGAYEVMLQELFDKTTPTRADYAIGYLDLRPVIEGDIDDDGHVNLADLAILAQDWLK